MIGKGSAPLQDLLDHISKWDTILDGTLADLTIQRVIPGDELGMEEIVFEGTGSIPRLVREVWESLGPEASLLESERKERRTPDGARRAPPSAASAGN